MASKRIRKKVEQYAEQKVEQRRADTKHLVRRELLRSELTEQQLAERFRLSLTSVRAILKELRASGANIVDRDGHLRIDRHLAPPSEDQWRWKGSTRKPYRCGIVADTHIGSKHFRQDVIDDLYDWFSDEGIDRVYHCGNWIEGERRFNKHELDDRAHGMEAQIQLFLECYPQRDGIKTFYVAGDDHEGWYSQDTGVDIGRLLQDRARTFGRTDLVYLGYKEAFVTLTNQHGNKCRMLVDHPGGGSSYAHSYAPQKRIEAAQSGEKPAIWLFGHWHKCGYGFTRGVHWFNVPCGKDLDTFGRKKGLEYVIGGWLLDIWQDEHGAVREIVPRVRTYFDRAYHNQQFSLSGPSEKRTP